MRPTVQRILDSITAPADLRNGRLDLLAANPLGAALYSPVFDDATGTPNMARFIFFNPRASDFFDNWDSIASDAVAILRPTLIDVRFNCPIKVRSQGDQGRRGRPRR